MIMAPPGGKNPVLLIDLFENLYERLFIAVGEMNRRLDLARTINVGNFFFELDQFFFGHDMQLTITTLANNKVAVKKSDHFFIFTQEL